ncbi:hypothetical protein NGM33_01825 [Nocardiopsis dassonvillei]|uniref:hypothetical protein n=1 Tax=Nocardiopsis dassonvillei TaxID=2014 RepID=UPI00102BB8A1|nr:hypothetical protein [Nocardiopsis dassonvillei]MCP3012054.1 hypothetical protein [Nocardiopsis dassonvillei]
MDRHTSTRRQRTLAVPLVALVLMCFMCALCHSTGPVAQAVPAATAAASTAATADCPERSREAAAVTDAAPAPAPQTAHACEVTEGHGLPTAPPLFLVALGVALVLALLLAPRPGPAPRPVSRPPLAPHGYGLLTLLCVQRV